MGAGEGSAMGTKGQPWGFLLYLLNPGRRTALHHLAVEPAWFIGPKVPYRFMRSPLRVLLHFFRETGANPASKSAGSGGRLHRRATRFDPEHQVGASADDGGCDAIGSIGCRQNEPCRYGLTLPGGELRPSLPFKPVFLISRSGSLDRLDQNE